MRIVILGAGISGHTAALMLREKLSREHEVLVVTPNKIGIGSPRISGLAWA